ncbi:MAG: tRNA (adenosine(37)-N6)-threonylcarbamoyltransferase complex dimerization subunit type 1 TsaB [Bacteroidales bacterium]
MNHQENPYILHIETATEVCSVAISKGKELIALVETANGNSHAKNLIVFIEQAVKEAKIAKEQLNAVGLSIGPGSYTGLRIGTSTAKGLAYSLDIPVITVATLESIVAGARHLTSHLATAPFYYVPLLDARRMEVFTALFDGMGQCLKGTYAEIVKEGSFSEMLKKKVTLFCGNGVAKCKEMLSHSPNAQFDETPLSAQNMIEIALRKFEQQEFENIAYFEPFYLKEYMAAKPVVKGLHS